MGKLRYCTECKFVCPCNCELLSSLFIGILCQICNQTTVRSQFRRHLLKHLNNNQLDMHEVNTILFNSRLRRKDSLRSSSVYKRGYICQFKFNDEICGRRILDLRNHLTYFHKLNKGSQLFKSLIKISPTCHGGESIYLSSKSQTRQSLHLPEELLTNWNKEPSNYSSEDTTSDSSDGNYVHKTTVAPIITKAIQVFRTFQAST